MLGHFYQESLASRLEIKGTDPGVACEGGPVFAFGDNNKKIWNGDQSQKWKKEKWEIAYLSIFPEGLVPSWGPSGTAVVF